MSSSGDVSPQSPLQAPKYDQVFETKGEKIRLDMGKLEKNGVCHRVKDWGEVHEFGDVFRILWTRITDLMDEAAGTRFKQVVDGKTYSVSTRRASDLFKGSLGMQLENNYSVRSWFRLLAEPTDFLKYVSGEGSPAERLPKAKSGDGQVTPKEAGVVATAKNIESVAGRYLLENSQKRASQGEIEMTSTREHPNTR